jgi:hypothetical protein
MCLAAALAAALVLGCNAGIPGVEDDDGDIDPDDEPTTPRPRTSPPRDSGSGSTSPTPAVDATPPRPADAGAPPDTGGSTMGEPDAGDAMPDAGGAPTDTMMATPAIPFEPPLQTSVPIIFLEVGGKALSKDTRVRGRIKIVEDHDGTHRNLATLKPSFESPMSVRIAGTSSAIVYPKKSLALKLEDAQGNESGAPLLGMPSHDSWRLYACYADKPCLRNALTYTLYRELAPKGGLWGSRLRFVEVYLDGKYHGMYNLVENVKRGRYRVPIPKVAPDMASGDITGGYIFMRNQEGKGPGTTFTSAAGDIYVYHYPKPAVITSAQKSYLRNYVDRFETMIKSSSYADPEKGYRKWIHTGSFVDYLLFSELSKNLDAYKKSAYMYKQADPLGGTLYFGPPWDYDLAYGNAWNPTSDGRQLNAEWGRTDKWVYDLKRMETRPEHRPPFWWYYLLRDPTFKRDIACRWKELRKGPVTTANINAKIDHWLKVTTDAEKRDHVRWPTIGKWVWAIPFVGRTLQEDIQYFRNFVQNRVRWMDQNVGSCPDA